MSPISIPGKVTLAKEFTWNETLWNPGMISTALWLDAADVSTITESGGAVSQWDDKSGNGRNAVQANAGKQPLFQANQINGNGVLTFSPTGTADYMSTTASPISGTSDYSIFTVAKTASSSFSYLLGQGGGGTGDPGLGIATTNNLYYGFIQDSSRLIFTQIGSDSADGTYKIRSDIFERSANWELFVNGSSIGFQSISTRSGSITGTTDFMIGTYSTALLGFWDGQVAEIIILASVVDLTNQQKIEGYLAHKWGLTANLPSNHPYKLVGPTP